MSFNSFSSTHDTSVWDCIRLSDYHRGDGIGATVILLHFHLPNLASICKYAGKETFSSKNSKIVFFFLIKSIKEDTCRKLAKYSKREKKIRKIKGN